MKPFALPLVAAVVALFAAGQAAADGPVQGKPLPEPIITVIEPTDPTITARVDTACSNLAARDPYSEGMGSVQFLSGYVTRLGSGTAGDDKLSYTPQSLRLGYMVTTPQCDNSVWYRGNFEVLLDYTYGAIVQDFGSYLTGPSVLARYNFVQQHCLIVPYIQCGAGVLFHDSWQATPYGRALLGGETAGLFRADIGARLMLTESLSFDVEVGCNHLANWGNSGRTDGINTVGFALGLTYFFRP
ncbi:MAG: acyloxyacyl hydrolase [Gemmataceae bacterium]